jgi:ribosomal protein S18 acetylase RimI-like enzyme
MSGGSASRLREAMRRIGLEDCAAMASIHARSGTPGLLSDLGEPFLRDVYYRGLLESPWAAGVAIGVAGRIAGFVTYSRDSDRLFSDIVRRRPVAFARHVLGAGLRRPRVLGDVVESVLRVRAHALDRGVAAEVVSLEVDTAFQGLGLGFFLLEAAVGELRRDGAVPIKARALAEHTAVVRLYERLGFRVAGPFRMQGRDWVMLLSDGAGS